MTTSAVGTQEVAIGAWHGRTATTPRTRQVFVSKVPLSQRIKKIAIMLATVTGVLFILSLLAFAYFYNQYSAIVEQRVRSGFWHSRGGVYAAPYKMRVGRAATLESLVDVLKRSGYVEGTGADNIWNGSFTISDNRLNLEQSPLLAKNNGPVEIKFSGGRIASITVDGTKIEEFAVEPEMLIGRTETRRTGNEVLQFEEIPENLKNAILIAEDQRFFTHYGIDPRGIGRAFWANLNQSEVRQGGSTITQQLVKNTFLSPERSYRRKFSEAFLALALENQMSKDQIFALYCNEIYLGTYGSSGIHGVEQAAEIYFGKKLSELSLAESAAIAAMIKNPNRFAPHKNAEDAKSRRDIIVAKMAELGNATASEAEIAINSHLELKPPTSKINSIAPHFVDAATKGIEGKFKGDYLNANFNTRVYTTIDTHLQKVAEKAVADHLAGLDRMYSRKGIALQASLVAIDPQNGHVLAMVGGRDYKSSQFNRATDAMRQPGSTFKPFVYATAIERGLSPASVFDDRPIEFKVTGGKPYKPENYGDAYAMKNITLKTALAKSSNVVAVRTAFEAGLDRVADKAEEFGFEKIQAYPSMALGTMEVTPLQLATAYAVFANGGHRVEPTFIDSVISGDESTLYQAPENHKPIITEQTAYMITDMLQAVVERGTARKVDGALGKNVAFAGKTGSSKDGWFVGYTPNLVTVVWVGTDDNTDLHTTGGEIALPLWTNFMRTAVQSRPEYGGEAFPMPRGLTSIVVDPETGMLADQFCPVSERVVLKVSSASNMRCLVHQPKIDTMLALDTGELEETESAVTIPAVEVPDKEITDDSVTRPYIEEVDDQDDDSRPRKKKEKESMVKPKDRFEDG